MVNLVATVTAVTNQFAKLVDELPCFHDSASGPPLIRGVVPQGKTTQISALSSQQYLQRSHLLLNNPYSESRETRLACQVIEAHHPWSNLGLVTQTWKVGHPVL